MIVFVIRNLLLVRILIVLFGCLMIWMLMSLVSFVSCRDCWLWRLRVLLLWVCFVLMLRICWFKVLILVNNLLVLLIMFLILLLICCWMFFIWNVRCWIFEVRFCFFRIVILCIVFDFGWLMMFWIDEKNFVKVEFKLLFVNLLRSVFNLR